MFGGLREFFSGGKRDAPGAGAAARPTTGEAGRHDSFAQPGGAFANPEESPERRPFLAPALPAVRASPRLRAQAAVGARRRVALPAGELPKFKAEECTLRSVADLRRTVDEFTLPPGCPTGPWLDDEAAKAELDTFFKRRDVCGGGWSTVWGTGKAGVLAGGRVPHHGPSHTVICHEHRDSVCKWRLTLEQCEEGWVVRSYAPHADAENGHSHELIQSVAAALARTSMRSLPEDLKTLGRSMIVCGAHPSFVFRFLKEQVEKDGGEAEFTYMDVYHACGASTGERLLDASNLVEMLRAREVEEGLFQRTTTDESGHLKEVFFAMAGAHKIYANEVEKQVVEIDHKVRACHLAGLLNCMLTRRAARH